MTPKNTSLIRFASGSGRSACDGAARCSSPPLRVPLGHARHIVWCLQDEQGYGAATWITRARSYTPLCIARDDSSSRVSSEKRRRHVGRLPRPVMDASVPANKACLGGTAGWSFLSVTFFGPTLRHRSGANGTADPRDSSHGSRTGSPNKENLPGGFRHRKLVI